MKTCQRFLLSILLLLAFATPGGANDPPATQPEESAQQGHLAIELDHPVSDQHISQPTPLMEVSGRAGTLPFFASDVVIAIDNSTLALVASGVDVDEDGDVGRNRSWVTQWEPLAPSAQFWTTDSGDTNQELQLRLARALVQRLADRKNRVGLASFTFRARTGGTTIVRLTQKPAVVVPVGEPGAVLAALDDFPAAQERRWTDLTRLLELAAELLDDATTASEPARQRAILLLSLGVPSAPNGLYWSSKQATEHAGTFAERGIAVWAIPFNTADPAFLTELTRASGGKVLSLDRLHTQFGASVPIDPRPRELEIENVTNQAPATNLRLFPDGRFDAMVPLEPGANTLEIRAVLADGRRETIRRVVHYDAGPAEQTP
jgi:hypothetical protein